jgi:antitoxin component of MazEF toxin-antitoxin module
MEIIKIKKIGGSLFIRIPKKIKQYLDLKEDDVLLAFKLSKNAFVLEKKKITPRSLARFARSLARE